MKQACGKRFFIASPETLLQKAGDVLDFSVSEEFLTEIQRVDESDADRAWTPAAFFKLLDRLAVQAPVQDEAILYASDHGGFVPREVVYDIGGYEKSRSLRGFTRPIRRLTLDLIAQGLIGPSAPDVLTPVYDQTIAPPGVAIGFKMPPELLWIISDEEESS